MRKTENKQDDPNFQTLTGKMQNLLHRPDLLHWNNTETETGCNNVAIRVF